MCSFAGAYNLDDHVQLVHFLRFEDLQGLLIDLEVVPKLLNISAVYSLFNQVP